jgi:HEAT repeat protein
MEQRQTKQQKREALTREVRTVAQQLGMEAQDGGELIPYLGCTDGLTAWAAADTLLQRGALAVPALIGGLSHPNGKLRATCALLLDHVADDRCIAPLLQVIHHDPLEAVRRCALHSLVCDGCKACPLSTDVVAVLMEVAHRDRSLAVRRRAVFYLSQQQPDPRVPNCLEALIAAETDAVLRRRAANALCRHRSTTC